MNDDFVTDFINERIRHFEDVAFHFGVPHEYIRKWEDQQEAIDVTARPVCPELPSP